MAPRQQHGGVQATGVLSPVAKPSVGINKRGPKPKALTPRLLASSTVYVDQAVFDAVSARMPDQACRRLLAYLVLGGVRDLDTWRPILGRDELTGLLGRGASKTSHSRLLDLFQSQTGVSVEIAPRSGYTGVASVVASVDYGDLVTEVEKVLEPSTDLLDRVDLVTGDRYGQSPQDDNGSGNGVPPHNDDAKWLLDRLNPPRSEFANIRRAIPDLRRLVQSVHGHNRERMMHDLQTLAQAESAPQPYYVAVPRTNRIYASGINSLTRELRTELEKRMSWVSFDIKQAQLSIVAELWDCHRLRELISSGQSFWESVLKDLGLPDNQHSRATVKTATYATIFGAGVERLDRVFVDAGLAELSTRFRTNQFIAELFEQRKQRLNIITSQGRVTDAYGIVRRLASMNGDSKRQSVTPRSLLAAEVQSYEMWMLVEPLRWYVDDGSVRLMTYLHDGFVIADGSRKVDEIRDDLVEQIVSRARTRNFQVQLEVK